MQVVGYETGAGSDSEPSLTVAVGGTVERESLDPGHRLAFTLGERRCAGVVDGGEHRTCDRPTAPYCDAHRSRWPCARCTGDCDRPLPTCREEHAIYLAAFAPATFKVGVTRSWRLRTRLREQGADRAAHLRTVADGRIAREIEAEHAREIPDSVRVPEKIRGLHRSVDDAAWRAMLGDFDVVETFEFDYGIDLDARPVAETLATGVVRGTKGRVLLLERSGGVYAVDLRDLVGHELTEGASERDLQANLGSFRES